MERSKTYPEQITQSDTEKSHFSLGIRRINLSAIKNDYRRLLTNIYKKLGHETEFKRGPNEKIN
ncbi:MAG TPA: hypothetical protein VFI61_00395 [Patescibacteria group bacterium]|nr:hypothetical protein [Patescibacteria group bacterium]